MTTNTTPVDTGLALIRGSTLARLAGGRLVAVTTGTLSGLATITLADATEAGRRLARQTKRRHSKRALAAEILRASVKGRDCVLWAYLPRCRAMVLRDLWLTWDSMPRSERRQVAAIVRSHLRGWKIEEAL